MSRVGILLLATCGGHGEGAEAAGLKLKRGRGPVQTLVTDHVEQPSEDQGGPVWD